MKTLVIIPAYGEAPVIAGVIEEVRRAQPEADVVVVDDCSPDATGREAQRAGAAVLRLPVNLGIGGAVQTGFKYALERDYEAVVQVDGDGQHDPVELEKVLAPLERGEADMVIGSRFLRQTGYKAPFARRVGMILFSTLARLAIGRRISDTTSGFRALNRRTFAFLALNYPVDFPDAETLVLVNRAGLRLREVSVNMRPRKSGRSSTTTLRSFYYPFKQILSILVVMLREPPPRPEAIPPGVEEE